MYVIIVLSQFWLCPVPSHFRAFLASQMGFLNQIARFLGIKSAKRRKPAAKNAQAAKSAEAAATASSALDSQERQPDRSYRLSTRAICSGTAELLRSDGLPNPTADQHLS